MKNNNQFGKKFSSTLSETTIFSFALTSSFTLWAKSITLPNFRKIGNSFCTLLVLVVMCTILTSSISFAEQHKALDCKKRILVQYHKDLPNSKSRMSIERHRNRVIRHLRGVKTHLIEISDDENISEVIENLSRDPLVKFVEEDKLLPPEEVVANDTYYDVAWHLEKIDAPYAWETSMGEGVIVAVLDTGVDEEHPDLFGQTVPGWNIYNDNADISDVYGHGTMVAGVIGAASDNWIGVTSIAWDARIMPVRISRPDGYAYTSDIANGIVWAADNGAQVANISYDVSGSFTVQNEAVYMQERGGVVVVSSGNMGGDRGFVPSTALISVGATDSNDVRALFSSYGEYLDLVAPGVGIYTTRSGGEYSTPAGTSFSSPIVAAVAALMISVNPDMDPFQIDTILKETADDLGEYGDDIYYGAGRINAAEAVLAAWESSNSDSEAPTVTIVTSTDESVSDIVQIDVSATDEIGVTKVELYIDSQPMETKISEPFVFNWDSTTCPDGIVTIVAYAYDAAGNEGISSSVTLDVQNEQEPKICGDLDEDGDVDFVDYSIFLGTFGLHASNPRYVEEADFDGNEWITLKDFAAWCRCYQDYLAKR